MRVLASAARRADAYPGLLAAIGESLGCAGALWLPSEEDGELRCAETWPAGAAAGASLVAEAGASGAGRGAPARSRSRCAGVGVMALRHRRAAGVRRRRCWRRWRASARRSRSSSSAAGRSRPSARRDARKSAILNAAFDCIITMDHNGDVVEVNRATERTFGYRAEEMIGRELAELIVPPALRAAHRRGVARYLRDRVHQARRSPARGCEGMRADGSEFPVEVVDHARRPPRPAAVLRLPARRHRGARRASATQRRLMEEQAALRRVATAVAASTDPRRVFSVVTEEVARLLGAQSSNMVRFNADGTATVVGGWSEAPVSNIPVGDTVRDGRRHRLGARLPHRRARARRRATRRSTARWRARLRGLGFRLGRRRADLPRRAPVGRGDRLQRRPEPFAARRRAADRGLRRARRPGAGQRARRARSSPRRARASSPAGDAERRRLERNLHDGAQQRLVSLALMLRLAARRHPRRRRPRRAPARS